jgi:hypothetical protein
MRNSTLLGGAAVDDWAAARVAYARRCTAGCGIAASADAGACTGRLTCVPPESLTPGRRCGVAEESVLAESGWAKAASSPVGGCAVADPRSSQKSRWQQEPSRAAAGTDAQRFAVPPGADGDRIDAAGGASFSLRFRFQPASAQVQTEASASVWSFSHFVSFVGLHKFCRVAYKKKGTGQNSLVPTLENTAILIPLNNLAPGICVTPDS